MLSAAAADAEDEAATAAAEAEGETGGAEEEVPGRFDSSNLCTHAWQLLAQPTWLE